MSNNQSSPYSSGRGFVHMTEKEQEQARTERKIGRGGLGMRYGEWGQLPNATGEVMRGVSADYDWRTYTPKTIQGHTKVRGDTGRSREREPGVVNNHFNFNIGPGRPELPFNGPPLMGPQQPGPVSQQAWGESSLLSSDAAKGGMGADAWPKESSITPAWAPKGGMGSDSGIMSAGSTWPHATGDAGQQSLPGISPDNGGFGTPTWESTRSSGSAISPQFSRQGGQGTLFGSDGEPSGDTFYRPPSNMGASRP